MCFYIHSKFPKVLTAKKNIVCYKRYDVYNKYKITRTNFDKINLYSPIQQFKTNLGAHLTVKKFGRYPSQFDRNKINKGLHSYTTFEKALVNTYSDQVIVKCIIPKGVKYYFNPDKQEYVSLQLKLTKKIQVIENTSIEVRDKKLLFKI